MNTIEQMCKEYGVEPIRKYCGNCEIQYLQYTNPATESCKTCKDYENIYPPFTAEKQIELIEFLFNRGFDIGFIPKRNVISVFKDTGSDIINRVVMFDELDKALARLFVGLKSYIDNSKVKEILEG